MAIPGFDKNRIKRWADYTEVLGQSPSFQGPRLSIHTIIFPTYFSHCERNGPLSTTPYVYIQLLEEMIGSPFHGFFFTQFHGYEEGNGNGGSDCPPVKIIVVFNDELTPDQQARAKAFGAQREADGGPGLHSSLFFEIAQRQKPCDPLEEPLTLDFTATFSLFRQGYLDMTRLCILRGTLKPFSLVRGGGFMVVQGRYYGLLSYMEELEHEFLNLKNHHKLPKYGVPFLKGPTFSQELKLYGGTKHPAGRRIYRWFYRLMGGPLPPGH